MQKLAKPRELNQPNQLDMVGERGFEPPTPWSRTRCSTRLSHSPTDSSIFYYSLRRTAFAFDLLKIVLLGLTGIFPGMFGCENSAASDRCTYSTRGLRKNAGIDWSGGR
jgi:hypothetical protein